MKATDYTLIAPRVHEKVRLATASGFYWVLAVDPEHETVDLVSGDEALVFDVPFSAVMSAVRPASDSTNLQATTITAYVPLPVGERSNAASKEHLKSRHFQGVTGRHLPVSGRLRAASRRRFKSRHFEGRKVRHLLFQRPQLKEVSNDELAQNGHDRHHCQAPSAGVFQSANCQGDIYPCIVPS